MQPLADARILFHLLRGASGGGSHAERLRRFYGPQADAYDAFRERLLHGREELVTHLPAGPGATVVELGGGTGRNLDFFGARLDGFARAEVVDLCAPLLEIARSRIAGRSNVRIVEADATAYRPDRAVDCVYFSYALTMIPDWFRAIDNALGMLAPGGTLGVVDFYVSQPHAERGRAQHGAVTRTLWPLWFHHDGVHLSPDHLPYLRARLDTVYLAERRAPLPYVPGLRVPYYVFVGRKTAPA